MHRPTTPPARSVPWLIIICGCLIAALTFGPRSAMGFFQLPMLAEKGWDRTTFGLAMALQNLFWGLGLPFFGRSPTDMAPGACWRRALLYAVGLFMMAQPTARRCCISAAASWSASGCRGRLVLIVLAAFARHMPPEKRIDRFGIGTAAGSAGMFIFAPISQGLIDAMAGRTLMVSWR